MPQTRPKNETAGSAMRRVSVKLDVDIPEGTLADLAEEALQTGANLNLLIARQYLDGQLGYSAARQQASMSERSVPAARGQHPRRPRSVAEIRGYRVGDFPHLYNLAPPGQRPYRGSGRPPQWLRDLIEAEIAAQAASDAPEEAEQASEL